MLLYYIFHTMPLDLNQWTGSLALNEVEEKPAQPLVVKYGTVEIDELGKVLTPTQVVHGYGNTQYAIRLFLGRMRFESISDLYVCSLGYF